jgi:hypothetical protein
VYPLFAFRFQTDWRRKNEQTNKKEHGTGKGKGKGKARAGVVESPLPNKNQVGVVAGIQ